MILSTEQNGTALHYTGVWVHSCHHPQILRWVFLPDSMLNLFLWSSWLLPSSIWSPYALAGYSQLRTAAGLHQVLSQSPSSKKALSTQMQETPNVVTESEVQQIQHPIETHHPASHLPCAHPASSVGIPHPSRSSLEHDSHPRRHPLHTSCTSIPHPGLYNPQSIPAPCTTCCCVGGCESQGEFPAVPPPEQRRQRSTRSH